MQGGWARWWVWTWGMVAVALIVLVFLIPFRWWAVATLVGFGTMEAIGLLRPEDAYPPLTQVIKRYVPRSIAFTAIYAFTSAAEEDPRSRSIQPGTYRLREQMSGQSALALMLDPQSRVGRVTVPEPEPKAGEVS